MERDLGTLMGATLQGEVWKEGLGRFLGHNFGKIKEALGSHEKIISQFWEFCTQKLAQTSGEVHGLKNTLELNLKGLGQAHSHFVSEAEKRFTEVYGWMAKREEREKTLWDQVGTLHRELGEVREAVHENAREGREQRRSEMDGIRNFLESQKMKLGDWGRDWNC